MFNFSPTQTQYKVVILKLIDLKHLVDEHFLMKNACPSWITHLTAAVQRLIKNVIKRHVYKIQFMQGLFYAKMPNSKLFIWPHLDQHILGVAYHLRETSDQKFTRNQKVLEFKFWADVLYAKNPKYKIYRDRNFGGPHGAHSGLRSKYCIS